MLQLGHPSASEQADSRRRGDLQSDEAVFFQQVTLLGLECREPWGWGGGAANTRFISSLFPAQKGILVTYLLFIFHCSGS